MKRSKLNQIYNEEIESVKKTQKYKSDRRNGKFLKSQSKFFQKKILAGNTDDFNRETRKKPIHEAIVELKHLNKEGAKDHHTLMMALDCEVFKKLKKEMHQKRRQVVKNVAGSKGSKTKRQRKIQAEGQANKSIRRMPWHWEPKKDVTSCDKLREGANIRKSVDFRMRELSRRNGRLSVGEYIACEKATG